MENVAKSNMARRKLDARAKMAEPSRQIVVQNISTAVA